MAFASSGSAAALRILLQRHAYTLMPHLLEILSCFPETLPPQSYIDILPKAGFWDHLEYAHLIIILKSSLAQTCPSRCCLWRCRAHIGIIHSSIFMSYFVCCRRPEMARLSLHDLGGNQTGLRAKKRAGSCRSLETTACSSPQSTWPACFSVGGPLQPIRCPSLELTVQRRM